MSTTPETLKTESIVGENDKLRTEVSEINKQPVIVVPTRLSQKQMGNNAILEKSDETSELYDSDLIASADSEQINNDK